MKDVLADLRSTLRFTGVQAEFFGYAQTLRSAIAIDSTEDLRLPVIARLRAELSRVLDGISILREDDLRHRNSDSFRERAFGSSNLRF